MSLTKLREDRKGKKEIWLYDYIEEKEDEVEKNE